jgi:hypothetical protein
MSIDTPAEMPWDIFEVDLVIDATGIYRSEEDMQLAPRRRCAAGADPHAAGGQYRPHRDPRVSTAIASTPGIA